MKSRSKNKILNIFLVVLDSINLNFLFFDSICFMKEFRTRENKIKNKSTTNKQKIKK